jgi:replicative DNA helicase
MRKKKDSQNSVDITNLVYGKVPPQAKDIEIAVLGAVMLVKHAFEIVAEILKPECFYLDAHQRIYKAMHNLQKKGQPIDLLTVVEELRSCEDLGMAGGPYYVTQLTNSVVSSANIEAHCHLIKRKYMAREMINLSGQTINDAYNDSTDVFELIADHEKRFTEISTSGQIKSYSKIDDELVEAYKRIEALREKTDHITGVPAGINDLDHLTHGWQDTDLIILAARPAVGKTALALQLARYAATNHFKKVPVAFFSLEMSKLQLTNRLLSAESDIPLDKILTGNMDDADMKQLFSKGMSKLANAPLFIDDTAGLNIFELRARARRLKRLWAREYGTVGGLIIIDYLQLMSGQSGKGNREQEISEISRGLKQLAKELSIPIIALSQLSRQLEQRTGDKKMPQLSDLRESGAIEQDADMVMFIYRPEYHDINTDSMGESTRGETHIRIAKHRHGSLETVKLKALLSVQKFIPWQDDGFDKSKFITPWQPVRLPYSEKDEYDI